MHQGEFGKYQIKHVVGMGGMSIVYLAVDQTVNREAALKVLNLKHASNPMEVRRFRREVEIAQRLRHPNIIDIFEYGEIDDFAYLAMEFMPGGSLAERYANPIPLKLLDAADVLRVLADALDYAHSQGVLHRDLKLANVLLNAQEQLILSDFGLALMQDASRITTTGQTFGTPLYMSPEQVSGLRTIDHRADIYSLGVIAYLLATGYFPFSGTSALMLLNQHLTEMPPLPSNLNPRLPHAIDDVLLRGLAKRPEDRFDSAGALAKAFADVTAEISATEIILLASQPTPIMEPSSAYRYTPSPRRNGDETNGANGNAPSNGTPFGDMTPKLTDSDLRLKPSLTRPLRNPSDDTRRIPLWIVAVTLAAVAVLVLIGVNTLNSILQASPTPVLPVIDATGTTAPEMIMTEEATATATMTLTPSRTPSPSPTQTRTMTRTPRPSTTPTESPTASRTPRSTLTSTARPTATRTLSSYLYTVTAYAEERSEIATQNAQQEASGEATSRPATQAQQGVQPTSGGSSSGGSSGAATSAPQTQPTAVPATFAAPTSVPPTSVPPTNAPAPTNTPVINLPLPTIPVVQTLLPGLLGKAP